MGALTRIEIELDQNNPNLGTLKQAPPEKKKGLQTKVTIDGDKTPGSFVCSTESSPLFIEKAWVQHNVSFYKTTRVSVSLSGFRICW